MKTLKEAFINKKTINNIKTRENNYLIFPFGGDQQFLNIHFKDTMFRLGDWSYTFYFLTEDLILKKFNSIIDFLNNFTEYSTWIWKIECSEKEIKNYLTKTLKPSDSCDTNSSKISDFKYAKILKSEK